MRKYKEQNKDKIKERKKEYTISREGKRAEEKRNGCKGQRAN